jgi:hypothetical protein
VSQNQLRSNPDIFLNLDVNSQSIYIFLTDSSLLPKTNILEDFFSQGQSQGKDSEIVLTDQSFTMSSRAQNDIQRQKTKGIQIILMNVSHWSFLITKTKTERPQSHVGVPFTGH